MRFTDKAVMASIHRRLDAGLAINRSDLAEEFGFTILTASKYIQRFLTRYPNVMRYDTSKRSYVKG